MEVVYEALGDLEALGCPPLDRAAALISAGLVELDTATEVDLGGALQVYQMFLERILAVLRKRSTTAGGGLVH